MSVNIPVPNDPVARQQLAVGSLVLPRSSFLDGFEYRLASPQGAANPVRIGIAEQPLVLETEPNDTPDKAQKILCARRSRRAVLPATRSGLRAIRREKRGHSEYRSPRPSPGL